MPRYTPICKSLYKGVQYSLSLCTWFLLLLTVQSFAQSVQVNGTVTDPSQSAIVNAVVTLLDLQTSSSLQATTDDGGRYVFPSVAPGTYKLQAEKAGFTTGVVPSLTVTAGRAVTRDLSLALSSTTTSVMVNAGVSGTASQGYYVSHVDQGVLGSAPVVNQPYTISILSSDMIVNTQVKSFRDAMMFMPLVSFTEQQGSEILRPSTRGLQGSIAQNTRMDGMAIAITGANAMEQRMVARAVKRARYIALMPYISASA